MNFKLSRGEIVRVKLGDLPDNQSTFDQLADIDFAIRFTLSEDPLESASVRYFDCLIWVKDGVGFDPQQIWNISDKWEEQLRITGHNYGVPIIGDRMSMAEFIYAMEWKNRPSESKYIEGMAPGVTLDGISTEIV